MSHRTNATIYLQKGNTHHNQSILLKEGKPHKFTNEKCTIRQSYIYDILDQMSMRIKESHYNKLKTRDQFYQQVIHIQGVLKSPRNLLMFNVTKQLKLSHFDSKE